LLAILLLSMTLAGAQGAAPPGTGPQQGTLDVGDSAPNFRLKQLGRDEWFELKAHLGKRPIVLIFGSYT
jgi:hypothetical protein